MLTWKVLHPLRYKSSAVSLDLTENVLGLYAVQVFSYVDYIVCM